MLAREPEIVPNICDLCGEGTYTAELCVEENAGENYSLYLCSRCCMKLAVDVAVIEHMSNP
jgi:hypothetical protein